MVAAKWLVVKAEAGEPDLGTGAVEPGARRGAPASPEGAAWPYT